VKEIRREYGTILKNFQEVKEAVNEHFEELYTENAGIDLGITSSMLENIPFLINLEENAELRR